MYPSCNGNDNGCGTIFKITPGGILTTLYSFCPPSQSGCSDGRYPAAGLVQGTDGNFYGTTGGGGLVCNPAYTADGCGTIFTITPGGTLTTLHRFDGADGVEPEAALVQDTNGSFYGTTSAGGANDTCGFEETQSCGAVFSLSVGLGPFVTTNPKAAKVGAKVGILGTNLTGATSVTFNGTVASFTVHSPTLILAEVPSGATTGTVQVKLPSGALSSNVTFIVLP